MTHHEFLSILFCLVLGTGIVLNYNLVHAVVNKKREWKLTRIFNSNFKKLFNQFGWAFYLSAILWYAFWIVRFEGQGLWFASYVVNAYLLTRIATWFVLTRRIRDERLRIEMAKVGPDGSLEREELTPPRFKHNRQELPQWARPQKPE